MDIKKIKSVEDLQKSGTVLELVEHINALTHPLKTEANTYEELYETVCCLQNKWLPFIKGPFISKQAEYIYYLTELEGKQRNKAIGITDDLYEDITHAKKWFQQLSQLVHPDKGGNTNAFSELKNLYDVMVDIEEDEDER